MEVSRGVSKGKTTNKMVQILIDTSVIIQKIDIEKDYSFFEKGDFAISILSEYEYLYGRKKFAEEKVLLSKLFTVLLITNEIVLKAIEIKQKLNGRGKPVSEIDYFIAATALVYNLELYTLDTDFLKIKEEFPELKLKLLEQRNRKG